MHMRLTLNDFRWLGVDHVYLTENSDPPPEYLVEQLQDFVDEGFLTLEFDGEKADQLNIYKRCMEKYNSKTSWMAFIDIDEYIVIRKCVPHDLWVPSGDNAACSCSNFLVVHSIPCFFMVVSRVRLSTHGSLLAPDQASVLTESLNQVSSK